MNKSILSITLLCALTCLFAPSFARADEEDDLYQFVDALVDLFNQPQPDFKKSAKRFFDHKNFDQLVGTAEEIHEQTEGVGGVDIEVASNTSLEILCGLADRDVTISVRLSKSKPQYVTELSFKVRKKSQADLAPISWENLDAEMQRATKNGFSGAVLITRDGKMELNKGYGLANREKNIKVTKDTVFAIGSAPIDFTHAGILLLKDQGKIELSDLITKYFDNVPDDKKNITLEFLMDGRSGFRDFHELASDENKDHSWIDRKEAIRRIMNQTLLFKPGERKRHSHSAWGLLAAVIEIVSGETYPEFTRKNLFQPAGMNDTGFFGDTVAEDRIAVGYGVQSSSPNSPPHWGKTSWLVMGSGGQVATLTDMYRWEVAMRDGSILSKESSAAYLKSSQGISQDGDSFGFEFMHSKKPEQLFMIISNSVDTRQDRRDFDQLGKRISKLVGSQEH